MLKAIPTSIVLKFKKLKHGKGIKEAREKKIQQLQQEVLLLYRRARIIHRFVEDSERRIFRMDVKKRTQGGVILLEAWTRLAEKVIKAFEKRIDQRDPTKLEQWLNRMYTYQGWKSCDKRESQDVTIRTSTILKLKNN